MKISALSFSPEYIVCAAFSGGSLAVIIPLCVLASLSEVIDESRISSGRHLWVRKQFFYWNSHVFIMTLSSGCRCQLVLHCRRFMVKKRPLLHKRQLSVSASVSLVAVVGFDCSVQVCWSIICFLNGGVSSGFCFVTGWRAALKHEDYLHAALCCFQHSPN